MLESCCLQPCTHCISTDLIYETCFTFPVNNNACCRVLGHSSKCSISFRSVTKADCQQLGICGRHTNSITAMHANSAGTERQPARGHTQGNAIHSAKSCPLPAPVPAALSPGPCACKVASLLCVTTRCLVSTPCLLVAWLLA